MKTETSIKTSKKEIMVINLVISYLLSKFAITNKNHTAYYRTYYNSGVNSIGNPIFIFGRKF